MKRYILTSAQIDPKYSKVNLKYIDRVDVVQGGEGPIPHMHILMKTGEVAYPRLDVAEYSDHHKDGYVFNGKEKREFINFMGKTWDRRLIQSRTTDEVKIATNYEAAVDTWIETYDGEDKFNFDSDGFPISPDYSQL